MAATVKAPINQPNDNNGDIYVGAKLYVYEAGTTTLRNVYTDSALTVPAANPQTSDAAGRFSQIYTADGVYKVRIETSAGVLIPPEYDNIDTGLSASVGSLPVSSGGTGATTAAAARANLGVPSTSELADLAADITTLSSSVQNIVSFPQGRLTLTTGTPVLATGVSAGTAVYYTAFVGNLVPVYDGTQFNARKFTSDLTLTLNSNHVASAIYDNFIFWDGSALQIGTGVAWNTATAAAGARGTGAGTTELTRINGLWVNKYDISYRNGATTGTIPAYQGTYVGSIYMDGTNGQVSCHTTYGQSRKWGVWNAYNRRKIILQAGDSTSLWNYLTNTIRASNGSSANSLTVFSGLPEEPFEISFNQSVQAGTVTATSQVIATWQVGIGKNSTTTFSGRRGQGSIRVDGTSIDVLQIMDNVSWLADPPTIGINVFTSLEVTVATSGSPAVNYLGGSSQMLLRGVWEG